MAKQKKIALDTTFSAYEADAMKQTFLDYLETNTDCNLNAKKVEHIDTVAIQLLLSFQLSLEGKGKKLILEKPSTSMMDALDRLALSQSFTTKAEA